MTSLRRRLCAVAAVWAMLTPGFAIGKDLALERKLREAFAAGALEGLHSVLVLHRGEVFAEAHFPGRDERWGQDLGLREHGPDTLHDLRSVTKPIVGLLYGVALAEGKVPDPEESLLAHFFSEYPDLAADPSRRAILVRHALSMTMGTEWSEDLPYSDPRNSEIAMEMASDRYLYVIERPVLAPPGAAWTYSGGAVALVARLIEDGVGMPIEDYAREKLFDPLGIERFEWIKGQDGVASAASGLRLRIHDLAKIGQMIADGGVDEGRRVIPADWLARSFAPQATPESGLRYGYLWWLAPWGDPPAWVAGFGNGGQRLAIQPQHDLVIAVFAGRYNDMNAWTLPVSLIEDFIVPALKEKPAK